MPGNVIGKTLCVVVMLIGGPIGHNGWLAVCWGVALTIGGYVWSKRLFARDPQR